MQIFSLFKVPARRGAFLLAPLISAILLRIAQSVVCIFEADRSFENETRWTKIQTPPKALSVLMWFSYSRFSDTLRDESRNFFEQVVCGHLLMVRKRWEFVVTILALTLEVKTDK